MATPYHLPKKKDAPKCTRISFFEGHISHSYMFYKEWKRFFKKRVSLNPNLCNHELNTNTIIRSLFLYFNNLHVLRKLDLHLKKDANQFWFEKNLDLHLIKMQISFCLRKLRSTSKEDVDLFLYLEKLRSTSYKDADLFFILRKIQIYIL